MTLLQTGLADSSLTSCLPNPVHGGSRKDPRSYSPRATAVLSYFRGSARLQRYGWQSYLLCRVSSIMPSAMPDATDRSRWKNRRSAQAHEGFRRRKLGRAPRTPREGWLTQRGCRRVTELWLVALAKRDLPCKPRAQTHEAREMQGPVLTTCTAVAVMTAALPRRAQLHQLANAVRCTRVPLCPALLSSPTPCTRSS